MTASVTESLTVEEQTAVLWPSKVLCMEYSVVKQRHQTPGGQCEIVCVPDVESGLKRGAKEKTASSAGA